MSINSLSTASNQVVTTEELTVVATTAVDFSERKLSFVVGLNCKDNEPYNHPLTFDEMVELFHKPDTSRGTLSLNDYLALDKSIPAQKTTRTEEKDGMYFIPVRFSEDESRMAEDVQSISCFVIDIDTGDISRENIVEKLVGLKYIAYSSYSHHPDNPRWRVIIPYAFEILPSKHKAVYEHFQTLFDGNLDTRCGTTNQIWYNVPVQ